MAALKTASIVPLPSSSSRVDESNGHPRRFSPRPAVTVAVSPRGMMKALRLHRSSSDDRLPIQPKVFADIPSSAELQSEIYSEFSLDESLKYLEKFYVYHCKKVEEFEAMIEEGGGSAALEQKWSTASIDLCSSRLIRLFSHDDILALSKIFSLIKIPANEFVLKKGEKATFFGWVIEGELEALLENNTSNRNNNNSPARSVLPVSTLPPSHLTDDLLALSLKEGSWIGAINYFTSGDRLSDVIAIQPSVVAILTYSDLNNLWHHNPSLHLKLIKALSIINIKKLQQLVDSYKSNNQAKQLSRRRSVSHHGVTNGLDCHRRPSTSFMHSINYDAPPALIDAFGAGVKSSKVIIRQAESPSSGATTIIGSSDVSSVTADSSAFARRSSMPPLAAATIAAPPRRHSVASSSESFRHEQKEKTKEQQVPPSDIEKALTATKQVEHHRRRSSISAIPYALRIRSPSESVLKGGVGGWSALDSIKGKESLLQRRLDCRLIIRDSIIYQSELSSIDPLAISQLMAGEGGIEGNDDNGVLIVCNGRLDELQSNHNDRTRNGLVYDYYASLTNKRGGSDTIAKFLSINAVRQLSRDLIEVTLRHFVEFLNKNEKKHLNQYSSTTNPTRFQVIRKMVEDERPFLLPGKDIINDFQAITAMMRFLETKFKMPKDKRPSLTSHPSFTKNNVSKTKNDKSLQSYASFRGTSISVTKELFLMRFGSVVQQLLEIKTNAKTVLHCTIL